MIVSVGEDKVDVEFFSSHLTHNCEIGRMHLTKDDRNQIAGKQ